MSERRLRDHEPSEAERHSNVVDMMGRVRAVAQALAKSQRTGQSAGPALHKAARNHLSKISKRAEGLKTAVTAMNFYRYACQHIVTADGASLVYPQTIFTLASQRDYSQAAGSASMLTIRQVGDKLSNGDELSDCEAAIASGSHASLMSQTQVLSGEEVTPLELLRAFTGARPSNEDEFLESMTRVISENFMGSLAGGVSFRDEEEKQEYIEGVVALLAKEFLSRSRSLLSKSEHVPPRGA